MIENMQDSAENPIKSPSNWFLTANRRKYIYFKDLITKFSATIRA